MMASMPLIPLPESGHQRIQPVYVDDLILAVCALVESHHESSNRIAMVGPEPLTLRNFYIGLRKAMGIRRRPHFLPVPKFLMLVTARFGRWFSGGFLDTDALSMLERGNVAEPGSIRRLLEHAPRGVSDFVPAAYSAAVATQSRMRWLLFVLRLSV